MSSEYKEGRGDYYLASRRPMPESLRLHGALATLRNNQRTERDDRFWEGWDAALAALEVVVEDPGRDRRISPDAARSTATPGLDFLVADIETQRDVLGLRPDLADRLRAALAARSTATPGWWHPAACVNVHDEGGNCLDGDGALIGWRELWTEDDAARSTATPGLRGAFNALTADWPPLERSRALAAFDAALAASTPETEDADKH